MLTLRKKHWLSLSQSQTFDELKAWGETCPSLLHLQRLSEMVLDGDVGLCVVQKVHSDPDSANLIRGMIELKPPNELIPPPGQQT